MGLFSSLKSGQSGSEFEAEKISIYLLPDIGTTYGTTSPEGLPEVVRSSRHSDVLLWDTLYLYLYQMCYVGHSVIGLAAMVMVVTISSVSIQT